MEEFQSKDDFVTSSASYPLCATPIRLRGKNIQGLNQENLYCSPPSLKSLELDLSVNAEADVQRVQATVKCIVQGSPELELGWFRKKVGESGRRKIFDFDPIPQSETILNGITQIVLHQPEDDIFVNDGTRAYTNRNEELITCLASDTYGNASADVKIIWPNRLRSTLSVTSLGDSLDDKILEIIDQADNQKLKFEFIHADRMSDIFFKKQFTILDLIGAVVGTFSATIALFLVGFRLLQSLRRRRTEDNSNSQLRKNANVQRYIGNISRFWLSPDDDINVSVSPSEFNVNSKLSTSQENPTRYNNLRQNWQYLTTNDDSAYSDCHTYDLPQSHENCNVVLPHNRQPDMHYGNNIFTPNRIILNNKSAGNLIQQCEHVQQNKATSNRNGFDLEHNTLNQNFAYKPHNFHSDMTKIPPDLRNDINATFSSNDMLISKFDPSQIK